jgi:iron complex transport system permease protein
LRSISSKYIIIILVLIAVSLLSLLLGSVVLSVDELINGIQTNTPVFQLRFSRTLTALFAGGGIAISGLLLQTLFRNPLAGPSVLGVSSGATFGVALSIVLSSLIGFANTRFSTSIMAVLGALAVVMLLLFAAKYIKKSNTLLIIGLMVGYFVSSLVNVFSFYTDKSSLQNFIYWGLGSFNKEVELSVLSYYILPILLLCFVSFMFIKRLDLLLLGERYAASMGVNVKQTRIIIILIAGLLIGVITAWCGPIAFLGIAVPHLARNILKSSKHFQVMIFTLLLGASLAIVCDIIARLPGLDQTLPINAITSFIGAPIVVWIIFKRKMI